LIEKAIRFPQFHSPQSAISEPLLRGERGAPFHHAGPFQYVLNRGYARFKSISPYWRLAQSGMPMRPKQL